LAAEPRKRSHELNVCCNQGYASTLIEHGPAAARVDPPGTVGARARAAGGAAIFFIWRRNRVSPRQL